jgi:hypothetical protein
MNRRQKRRTQELVQQNLGYGALLYMDLERYAEINFEIYNHALSRRSLHEEHTIQSLRA